MRHGSSSAARRWRRRVGRARLLLFPPLLIAALSLPLALRLVRPNGFYGVRTVSTLRSPEQWYAANARAGIAGVALGLTGALIVHAIMRSRAMSDATKALVAAAVALLIAFGSMLAGLLAR